MPEFSVVIPTYNRADLIGETLDSVFAQTCQDFEIIVVDDGSQDNLRDVLAPLIEAQKIRYIYQENAGLPAARNTGIRNAHGNLIAFLDSDDLFTPQKLEKQLALFKENPQAMLVHAFFSKFDNQGNELGIRDTSMYAGHIYPQMLLEWDTLMAAPCVVVCKEVFEQTGYFDESLHWAEDLDMWRRIARVYPFYLVKEPLAKIRVHHTSMSSDKTKAAAAFMIYLHKAFEDDPALPSGFKKRVLGRMYTNVAHNLLGAGKKPEMRLARAHCLQAIRYSPATWGAYSGLLLSLIPLSLREQMIKIYRRIRYKTV